MFAIREEGFIEFGHCLKDASTSATDPRESLATMAWAHLEFAERRPHHYQIMFLPSEAKPSAAGGSFDTLHDCIKQLQARGQFQGQQTLSVAVSFWSWVHGLALLHSQGQLEWLGYPRKLSKAAFEKWLQAISPSS